MKRERCISILFAVLTASACTVLENRGVCPSYLNLTVCHHPDEGIFPGGKAWCLLYDEKGEIIESSSLEKMDIRDTTLLYSVQPRRTVTAVTSGRVVSAGCVYAAPGEQMDSLYAFRKDLECRDEEVSESILIQDKQFCTLSVNLDEEALPYASDLILRIEAPCNGTTFPSLEAHSGEFLCQMAFGGNPSVIVRLPRQGSPGLTLLLRTELFTATYDMYEVMSAAGYDWTSPSLEDFRITVSINASTGQLEISEWEVEEMGDKEF